MTNIQSSIRKLAGVDLADSVKMFDAKVILVNENERTVQVEMIGGKSANRITARLMATVNDGCYIIPKDSSTVIVAMSTHVEPYVAMFSEVEKITWLGGYFDGVPIVTHPTDSNKGLLKKINELENEINDLKTIFSTSWTPVPNDGGAALKTAAASWSASPIVATTQIDIEHPNILH